MIRNKTIKFNLDKPEERELWGWLQARPHGEFSEATKSFWNIRMKHDNTSRHEQRIQEMINVARKNGYKGESPF